MQFPPLLRRCIALVLSTVWLAFLVAGCSRENLSGTRATWMGAESDPIVVVIGVVDLRAAHLAELPTLRDALSGGTVWDDALSAGAGATGALALLDGRAPLDQLREAGGVLDAARAPGWDIGVLAVPATLRSEPEWVDAGLASIPVRTARGSLPSLGELPRGRVWRVLLLDPFSHADPPLTPRPTEPDPAGRQWLDSTLAEWIEELRNGPHADRLHVVLTGIPRAPAREQRARALPGGGPLPQAIHVPWVWAPARDQFAADSEPEPVLVHEQIARALGRPFTPAPQRWSAWWSDHSGGLYVELIARDDLPLARAWIDERGRWTSVADEVERDLLDTRRDEFDTAALALSFDAAPRLWCAVRGSEELDFVDLSVVADGIDSALTGWALEDIDLLRSGSLRVRTLALAVEPRGDGAMVDLGWPPRAVELRLSGAMAGSPLIGNEFFAGASARMVGLGSMRLAPFTRSFWRAASGGWPEHADAWWPSAAVGVHVVISAQARAPSAATWDE